MAEMVKWGILGTGAIANSFAIGLRSVPDAQLLAVGSRTAATAEAFAREHGVPRPYESYEKLAEDGDIDAVYIATPNTKHKENSILCLEAGKAVLCEKPFTINAAEAREVITLARRKRLFCMEAMWMRFMPLILELDGLIGSNAIGEVHMLEIQLGYRNQFDPNSRVFDLELGGGALLDLGVYPISLAFKLLGPHSSVVSVPTIGDSGVDEQAAVLLGYPGGQIAVMSVSLRAQASNEALIVGTEGQIRVHAPFFRPHRLSITRSPRPATGSASESKGGYRSLAKRFPLLRSLYLRLDRYLSPGVLGRDRRIVRPFTGNGYNYEAMELIRCLRSGEQESPIMPLDETLSIVETMDAIRGQWNLKYPQEVSSLG